MTSRTHRAAGEDAGAPHAAGGGDLRDLIARAEEMMAALADDSGEAAAAIRERVGASVAAARARLGDLESDAREMTDEAVAAADRYVRGNPWAAVAIAAAAGVVIGALLTRRG
jgi:ElaB/YqjD/DUF883 family membrane-anchored ribosome-binding protein